MNKPLVHVLVINWNGRDHLAECFDSLVHTTYPNVRLVLIDNASSDDSVSFVRSTYGHDGRVAIIENASNLGWSRGNNVGMRRALDEGAHYLFLLNNDTVTAPDAIERLVAAAEADPELGALAPKMLLYDNPALINSLGIECSLIGNGWDLGLGRLDGPKWDKPRPLVGVCGGAAFYRADALRKSGVLPEDFDIYLDDLDLSLRLWNSGYAIRTCPGAVVKHKFSATMGQGKRERLKYYLNTRNRFKLMLRNFPRSSVGRVLPAVLLGEARALGRAVLDGKLWRVLAHLRAWAAFSLSAPGDLRARRGGMGGGARLCPFWSLIRTDALFFRGVHFPDEGWYPPRVVEGAEYRPISANASLQVAAGKLRVAFVNCYPAIGCLDIEVLNNKKPVTSLQGSGRDEVIVEVEQGILEFRGKRVFDADDTGERVDLAGWIRVESSE